MRAGLLRAFISVLPASTGQDNYGQPTAIAPLQPVLNCWAQIGLLTGKEIYALGAGFTSQVTHKVSMRFPVGVTIKAGMTVQYGDRTFRIQAVSDPTERQRDLDLIVLEESK